MTDNREHLLKMLLGSVPDVGEHCEACAFPTENDALAYAARLAKLQPGDVVFVHKSSMKQRCIFVRPCPESGAMVIVMYYNDDKEISIARVGHNVLSLPNEPFIVEEQHD